MRVGDLRQRITIQQLSTTINDNGFEGQTWSDYKTVWASANNLFGREYFQAMQVQAETTVKFTIRYTSGLTADMRILFNGKTYNIDFIDNIKYANKYLEIKALEVV